MSVTVKIRELSAKIDKLLSDADDAHTTIKSELSPWLSEIFPSGRPLREKLIGGLNSMETSINEVQALLLGLDVLADEVAEQEDDDDS
jgi:hypothetical protein